MWRRIVRAPNRLLRLLSERRTARYLQNLRAAHHAPYPIRLYADLLAKCSESRTAELRPFTDQAKASEGRRRVFVRHDIDTKACTENVNRLMEVDRAAGIGAGVYFRADDAEYRLRDQREVLCSLRNLGFEVGLHTACYLQDDFLAAFRRETESFAQAAKFQPRSFTVHGMGDFRQDVRSRFLVAVADRLTEFGYDFVDWHPRFRGYGYVIHDCHIDEQSGSRCLLDDFAAPPLFQPCDWDWLILTHPVYWKP